MNGRRPEITAGTVEVMTIRIHCPYCDAVYMAENGDPIVRDTDESFHALPRTLVCKACMCRFVKPTPLGWGRHYTGAKLRPTERKPQPTPGMGATRPGASQTPIAGRTAVRSLDMAIETIRAARSMLRRP